MSLPRWAAEGGLVDSKEFGADGAPVLLGCHRFVPELALCLFRQILAGLTPASVQTKREHAHLVAERLAPPDLRFCADKHACMPRPRFTGKHVDDGEGLVVEVTAPNHCR